MSVADQHIFWFNFYTDFKICSTKEKKRSNITYVIVGVLALGISTSIVAILWWKGCFKGKKRKGKGESLYEWQK